MPSSFTSKCLLVQSLLLLLAFSTNAASSYWTVKSLPGFSGELPFTLETGYVSVGDIEYFYYFVESESDQPGLDPLILYLNGGPGCSGLNGLLYQAGPLEFNLNYSGHGIPELLYVPYSWTKTSNIIFLDAPVGAGFSYATNASSYASSDSIASAHMLSFLRSWLEDHLDFKDNPFFLSSDSYAGIYVPMIAQAIINNNEAGELKPRINLKGYIISCAHTDTTIETNSKIPYAHRMALISDAMYKNAERSCNGSYAEPTNAKCYEALEAITLNLQNINRQNILSPNCAFLSPETTGEEGRRSLSENSRKDFLKSLKAPDLSCHNFNYLLSDLWTNYESVQEALHVRPGTVKQWWRCNTTLSYTVDVNHVVAYHQNLTETGLQILALSGDHDMVIPHVALEEWIASLDLTVDYDWRPWFVAGQVAGYNIRYTNDGYRFTYVTIRGAGHSPPEWKRKEVYEMFNRWIHYKAI
ncbi:hypothetical protein NMG60_11019816 [Bertholletia excelsa]